MPQGSYLKNNKLPKIGDNVWILAGQFADQPKSGKVTNVTNIDKRGLANTYLDVNVGGKLHHVNVDQVYDHKPKKVIVTDQFGETSVWAKAQENPMAHSSIETSLMTLVEAAARVARPDLNLIAHLTATPLPRKVVAGPAQQLVKKASQVFNKIKDKLASGGEEEKPGVYRFVSMTDVTGFWRALRAEGIPAKTDPWNNLVTVGNAVVEAAFKIGVKDRGVLKAFLAKKAADGQKLSTDGQKLDGHWMGGNNMAEWKGDKLHFHYSYVGVGQTILRALKNLMAPAEARNIILGTTADPKIDEIQKVLNEQGRPGLAKAATRMLVTSSPKSLANEAAELARFLVHPKIDQRNYDKIKRKVDAKIDKIVKLTKAPFEAVQAQIYDEAQRRGGKLPTPGKDV